MKLKDLMDILNRFNPEIEVFLEYDSFCRTDEDFSIAQINYGNNIGNGIYLCCESDLQEYLEERQVNRPDDEMTFTVLKDYI